jgi:hypothetical protein
VLYFKISSPKGRFLDCLIARIFFNKATKLMNCYTSKLFSFVVCSLNTMLLEHKNAKRKESKFFFNFNADLLGQEDVGTIRCDYQVK